MDAEPVHELQDILFGRGLFYSGLSCRSRTFRYDFGTRSGSVIVYHDIDLYGFVNLPYRHHVPCEHVVQVHVYPSCDFSAPLFQIIIRDREPIVLYHVHTILTGTVPFSVAWSSTATILLFMVFIPSCPATPFVLTANLPLPTGSRYWPDRAVPARRASRLPWSMICTGSYCAYASLSCISSATPRYSLPALMSSTNRVAAPGSLAAFIPMEIVASLIVPAPATATIIYLHTPAASAGISNVSSGVAHAAVSSNTSCKTFAATGTSG